MRLADQQRAKGFAATQATASSAMNRTTSAPNTPKYPEPQRNPSGKMMGFLGAQPVVRRYWAKQ
jgi:hypothetical protein